MPERSSRFDLITEGWYPRPDEYWVPEPDAVPGEWPHRFGDLFKAPATDAHGVPLVGTEGTPWDTVMVYSPSCELINKAKPSDTVEVARVLPLGTQDDAAAQRIIVGWQEKDAVISVAFAHTVFLAGLMDHPTHSEPMFAHLKSTARVTLQDLRSAGRIAALTHEARVSVIRRDLYYRYRWLIPQAQVWALETNRISDDRHFSPPRPSWAPLTESPK